MANVANIRKLIKALKTGGYVKGTNALHRRPGYHINGAYLGRLLLADCDADTEHCCLGIAAWASLSASCL